MQQETHHDLFKKGLLQQEQYDRINLVHSGRLVSLFYELRSLLYLGILLFTSGTGILIYQNIGEWGHLIAILVLMVLTAACFGYIFLKGPPYSKETVEGPTPYFDYVTLLGALLFIAVLGYLQFRFSILDENMGYTTLVTAAFFFYVAYRFDHAGVLTLAITALASFWSISLSPQKWYSGHFVSESHLHFTAMAFGAGLGITAMVLDNLSIKKHFTFSYLNFAFLSFFSGAIASMFIENGYGIYVALVLVGCGTAYYLAMKQKSFLFLLYAFLAGYIATTVLLAETLFQGSFGLWFFYSLASCGGFVWFIIHYKNYFSRST